MQFRTIEKRAEALRNNPKHMGYEGLAHRVQNLIWSAINNADDTNSEDTLTEKEYLAVAHSSLEVLIAGCNDAEVQAWYRKQGFAW